MIKYESALSTSYQRQLRAATAENDQCPTPISAPLSIDAFNHRRHLHGVRRLIQSKRSASWLTIGDSGADAHMLQELGAGNIIASGLADIQLQSLRDRGLLKGCEVRAINAECIDVADESVDFVFCRQAFHHFPRPFVGFYEMLRVCRVGVILIEPADVDSLRPLEHVRALAKMLLRRPGQENRLFEPAGNFIYRVSRRELWKACVALQLDSLYTRPFNHFFLRDVCAAPTTDRTRLVAYHTAVGLQDLLAKAGLLSWGLLAAVVAKQSLGSAADTALRSSGFRRERLPRNPYL